jgi:signal transduction histidine kinase
LLLSVASHEIRGVIGVARGYLRLLAQDATVSDRSRTLANGAAASVERVVAILDDMSEYVRLVRGELRLERSPHPWTRLMEDARARVEWPTSPRVVWRPPALDHLAPAAVDCGRVERALAALIDTLARAQAQDADVTARTGTNAEGRRGAPAIDLVVDEGAGAVSREPDLSRSGLGFRLALAHAVIAAHGGALEERWRGGRWVGYRISGMG